jgi:mRNA interferase MazF
MKLGSVPRGTIVLVAFPFTDLSATKVRPALVLSNPSMHRRERDVILAAISSLLPKRPAVTSVIIRHTDAGFASTGLRVSSVIHCAKIVTVEGALVLKRLGRLGRGDLARIDGALARAVGLASSRSA